MKTIVAVDKEWGIGKKNDLLFHLTKDLQYFKEKTLDKVIVMGGNTLLSFPGSKPLPRRTNIVLTDVFKRDLYRYLQDAFSYLSYRVKPIQYHLLRFLHPYHYNLLLLLSALQYKSFLYK